MKLAEKIILLVVIIGLIFKLMHWPFAGLILTISLTSLAMFYIASAFNAFEDKDKNRGLSVVCGIFMSITTIGILFKFMHWPMANIQLLVGAIPLPILFLVTLLLKLKQKDEILQTYYKNMLLRLGIFIILLFLFINTTNVTFIR